MRPTRLMAVAVANALLLTDGDAAFLRVDNRRPAHALEPGVAAAATNKRFDQGKAGPRYGVALDEWGMPGTNLISGNWAGPVWGVTSIHTITGLTIGARYNFRPADANVLASATQAVGGDVLPAGTQYARNATFTAETTTYYLFGINVEGNPIQANLTRTGHTLAYERFNDPTSRTDNTILITDDWRDANGEDGGIGRAWRIRSGMVAEEIPLNGHDAWTTGRLIQCHNAMILLRQDNERHYFVAADCNALTDQIALHCAPSWASGTAKRVRLELASDGAQFVSLTQDITDTDATADTITVADHGLTNGAAKLVTGLTGVTGLNYVRSASSSTLQLYDTAAHAIAGGAPGLVDLTVNDETGTLADRAPAPANFYWGQYTLVSTTHILELYQDETLANKMLFEAGTLGKFYVELATDPAPWFGNGAPGLILQPSFAAGLTTDAFLTGFVAVTANVVITAATASIITAPNHRFYPGDPVTPSGLTIGTAGPYYAFPLSEHTLTLHASALAALSGASPIGTITPTTAAGLTIKKTSAAGMPLPPCREGHYKNGRFWGIVDWDTIVQSDPFDFLHYTSYVSTVAANQGEAGRANWLRTLGANVLLVGKDQKIIGLSGIGGAVSGWSEGDVTTEYGGIAPLAVAAVGTDLQFASRKGWASATRTVADAQLGRAQTVSRPIAPLLKDIDWSLAASQCARVWNNRLFWSVALKGQNAGEEVNNATYVLNLENSDLYLEQTALEGEIIGRVREYADGQKGPDCWEGVWTGDLLTPYSYAPLTVAGEERLTWATPDGLICWFHDGWDDAGADITDELLTRGYFGTRETLAHKGVLQVESYQPNYSAYVRSAGYQEEEQLTGFDELEYDRTKYLVAGQTDYDPDSATEEDFNRPHRADYSPADTDLAVSTLDVHQCISEPFRCRLRDHSIQLRIVNTQGSLRIAGTVIQGRPVGIHATRKT